MNFSLRRLVFLRHPHYPRMLYQLFRKWPLSHIFYKTFLYKIYALSLFTETAQLRVARFSKKHLIVNFFIGAALEWVRTSQTNVSYHADCPHVDPVITLLKLNHFWSHIMWTTHLSVSVLVWFIASEPKIKYFNLVALNNNIFKFQVSVNNTSAMDMIYSQ